MKQEDTHIHVCCICNLPFECCRPFCSIQDIYAVCKSRFCQEEWNDPKKESEEV